MTFDMAKGLFAKRRKGSHVKRLPGRSTIMYYSIEPAGKYNVAAFCIKYHWTTVLKIREDNTWVLNSGRFRTVTTKARINEYSPARVYSHRGKWYLWPYTSQDLDLFGRIDRGQEFFDGMMINRDGEVKESS